MSVADSRPGISFFVISFKRRPRRAVIAALSGNEAVPRVRQPSRILREPAAQ